ncbi:MAG: hypothetical protein C4523_13985 [Myxococcales bacterium]|nr:MAG: hypothetical protein C4523_13985 [Myxococcales bacterium]
MKRTLSVLTLAMIGLALSLPEANADRRIFGYTYPYMTLPEGAFEIEHYLDMGLNGWDDPNTPKQEKEWTEVDWTHQVEFEYGITDNLDFGFYNVFRQKPYDDFVYEGLKLRTRYRFGERDRYGLDPAIYFEVGYFGDEVKLEEMLILSKVLGGWELSFNLKGEQEYKLNDKEWEFEVLPLFGFGYHFNPHVALSLEYYGKLKIEGGEYEYFANYLGPALSVAGGPFYWTLAVQPQLGTRDGIAAVQIRSLFGIQI